MKRTSLVAISLAALTVSFSAHTAVAASVNNHFEIDLQNYRACKADADGNRLSTCYGNDVRSGSQFYLADGSSNSISVTNTGVVKARIEGLRWDVGATTSFACPNYTCDLNPGSPYRYRCQNGPLVDAPCLSNAECGGSICVGGPHDGDACTPASPNTVCKSLANADNVASVVFGGNQASVTFVNGYPTRVLNGDSGDPANGCTKICSLSTNGSGIVDSNALTCVAEPSGCTLGGGYHVVKVLDLFGKQLAVPGLGTASAYGGAFGITDAAMYGDVCRSGSPPADCADDQ